MGKSGSTNSFRMLKDKETRGKREVFENGKIAKLLTAMKNLNDLNMSEVDRNSNAKSFQDSQT